MKFVVGEEVGRGGFCMVHRVTVFDDDGKEVPEAMAMKRLRDDLHEPPAILEELRLRFEREARLLDDVLDHKNIIPVRYRNLSGDNPFFVMPLADCNVWDRANDGPNSEEWVCAVFRQILEGMAYAHGKGVIHRDLKPQNALLRGDQILLNDLGFGKNLDGGTAGLTKTFYAWGTEAYVAPEQASEMKATGPSADVFSLGKLLMALLTGCTPEMGVPDVSELPERFRSKNWSRPGSPDRRATTSRSSKRSTSCCASTLPKRHCSHNRFYVRDKLLEILMELDEATDTSTIAMAVDEIRARPEPAAFVARRASRYELPRPIEAALQAAER
jgi:serine/threonine protein kinase